MYILKNSLKNLKRNKSRNFMIGAIIFAIVLTIVISMVINSTSSGVIDDYKSRFGSEVYLSPNFDKLREEMDNQKEDGPMMMMRMPELTAEQYLKFAESDLLKKTTLVGDMSGNIDSLKAIDEDAEEEEKNNERPGRTNMMVSSVGFGGGNFRLMGDSWAEFDEGTRELESGAMPENKNEVILSTDLRDENNLNIGDTFKFKSEVGIDIPEDIDQETLEDGQTLTINGVDYNVVVHDRGFIQLSRVMEYELKVVGFYDDLTDDYYDENMPKMPFLNSRNQILTNLETLTQDRNDNETGISIQATYYLENPDLLSDFEAELRAKGLPDTFDVGTDSLTYDAIVKPVEGMKKISMTFMFVVMILGSLILMLLTSISIGERKYEIGVLRAMGMKKKNVIFGLWFELLTITGICLVLALGTGAVIAQPISDKVLASQSRTEMNQGGFTSGSISIGSVGQEEKLESIEIKLDGMTIMQIVVISIGLSSLAGFVSMRKITQYEPIKILMERN